MKKSILLLMVIAWAFTACNRFSGGKSEKTETEAEADTGSNSSEVIVKDNEDGHIQQIIPQQKYNLPVQIDLFQFSPKSEYGESRYPDKGESFLRMWGWSKDGKAAYSLDNYGYAKGGFSVTYYVIDTITDIVLCHLVFDSDDFDIPAGLTLENFNLLYTINNHTETIKEANEKYGIIEDFAGFQSFPANTNGNQYTSSAAVRSENDEGLAKINYDINVTRGGKTKTLGTYSKSGPNLSLFILGYFKSPHENRILVVSAITSPFSGDVYTYFTFSGCHLDAGF